MLPKRVITPNDDGIILRVENVSIGGISRNGNSVNLDLKQGEIHAIMGESGAGKTGLAHILAGLKATDYGLVHLGRSAVEIKSPSQALALGVGVLFQDVNYSYIPHFKVKEYLFIWSNPFLVSGRHLQEKARRLMAEYGMSIDPNTLLVNLTMEERRLLALMKLLARDPAIVVLDEPSSDLSETGKQHLFRIIRDFVGTEKGVLYLSNQLDEILQLGDRVTILKHGGTLACFPMDYARKNPERILRLYFGHEEQDRPENDEFKEVIDTLLHTTELLTSEYELQDILNMLVEKISKTTRAEACNILLLDEASTTVVEAFRRQRSSLPEIDLREEVVRDVIQSGKPLILGNLKAEDCPRYFHLARPIKALACVPIKVRSKINGAIELFYMQKRSFNQEDVELLQTFATQAAIAIENTRLLGRSTLLKEAHHRIKNNLQSIVSLLLLQLQTKSPKSLEALVWQIIDRIRTIAGVHEILSRDEKGIGLINFSQLVDMVITNFDEKDHSGRIRLLTDVAEMYISHKTATSLGLILNELLTNCFEHAFPDERTGEVRVRFTHDENDVYLEVSDDGIGMDQSMLQAGQSTLGLSLVKILVSRDLRGTIAVDNSRGTRVGICFPRRLASH